MEGTQHPDRDEQFHFINRKVKEFQERGYPVISVDAKKKENIGQFKNAGTEWERCGQPVATHMIFLIKRKVKLVHTEFMI